MLEFGPHVIVAVADGAGGMGGGGAAADLAISLATTLPDEVRGSIDSRYWTTRLLQIDAALASDPGGGQAALVVASVFEDVVVGAAAGDAVAWLIDAKDTRDLTAGTPRKPFWAMAPRHRVPSDPLGSVPILCFWRPTGCGSTRRGR